VLGPSVVDIGAKENIANNPINICKTNKKALKETL
jgi:hypothetical protein